MLNYPQPPELPEFSIPSRITKNGKEILFFERGNRWTLEYIVRNMGTIDNHGFNFREILEDCLNYIIMECVYQDVELTSQWIEYKKLLGFKDSIEEKEYVEEF